MFTLAALLIGVTVLTVALSLTIAVLMDRMNAARRRAARRAAIAELHDVTLERIKRENAVPPPFSKAS
jgi:hypothetical protein